MQSNYLVISEHGLAFIVKPEPEMSNLKFLQTIVGGLIERVPVNSGHVLEDNMDCWVNEEGLIHNLNINMTASIICNHMIAGTAVFAGYDNGESTPCPESFINRLVGQGLALEGSNARRWWTLDDVMKVIELDNEGAKDAKSL